MSIQNSVNRKSNVFALVTPTRKSNENLIFTRLVQLAKKGSQILQLENPILLAFLYNRLKWTLNSNIGRLLRGIYHILFYWEFQFL